ncbi:laccase domain protein [Thiosulfatimonas sediminis]|uniref:Purine nucleoside phosphorylase n=1 Tax=Thiosulfatimonas sediminis TaxID=2675054 RepID=A0A6F8PUR9_9GAMM|nr:peptidoglycan editing factor PgeF [Thiosulfatimonas sediminis]BBP45764.1 laccase domain protein [Thiosulfatimonas sediminis]
MRSSIPIIQPDWSDSSKIHAFATTRQGGLSSPPYASLNPALHVQDNPQQVLQNRLLIEQLLPAKPLWLQQQHTTDMVYLPDYYAANQLLESDAGPIADAVWTDQPRQPCVIMTADCMPILLADTNGAWVAAIHAGWRGLLEGIIEKTLQQISLRKSSNLASVKAWIGPAISQAHFTVGSEVRSQFLCAYPFSSTYFVASAEEGKFQADLNGIAAVILQRLAVGEVVQSGLCTYAEPQRFYSYRYACHHPMTPQQSGLTGRIATFIWLAD